MENFKTKILSILELDSMKQYYNRVLLKENSGDKFTLGQFVTMLKESSEETAMENCVIYLTLFALGDIHKKERE